MQIYYYEGEDRKGPVNPAQLKTLAASGRVTPETPVEIDGKKVRAAKVKGLSFAPASAPAPPVVPPPAPDPVLPAQAAEPAPETETRFTPFGAVQVEITPTPEPAVVQGDTYRQLFVSQSNAIKKEGTGFFVLAGIIVFSAVIVAGATESLPLGLGVGSSAAPFYFFGRLFRWLGAYGQFLSSRDK